MEETEKKMLEDNYRKIMSREADVVSKDVVKERDLLKAEVAKLRSDLKKLKQVHKTQTEIMKEKQLRWEGEREPLKEDKRKVEYMLYDILKESYGLKDKAKKIKAICDN